MIELIQDRSDIKQGLLTQWDQGGRNKVITDTNCTYALTPTVTVKVRHLKRRSNRPSATNLLLRIDQAPGGWEDGNFQSGDKLVETDEQTEEDGPIVITFHDAVTDAPCGVRAAGANIQSCTYGEFTGVITVVDLLGASKPMRVLGESNDALGTAIFIGAASAIPEIRRIEFRTTNIVENGHQPFDVLGFAINQLAVQL
jgi:hypothetical protein